MPDFVPALPQLRGGPARDRKGGDGRRMSLARKCPARSLISSASIGKRPSARAAIPHPLPEVVEEQPRYPALAFVVRFVWDIGIQAGRQVDCVVGGGGARAARPQGRAGGDWRSGAGVAENQQPKAERMAIPTLRARGSRPPRPHKSPPPSPVPRRPGSCRVGVEV